MPKKLYKLLVSADTWGNFIHACPYCHRYVKRERGVKICLFCYGAVDNNRLREYSGPIRFDGGQSWLMNPLCQSL